MDQVHGKDICTRKHSSANVVELLEIDHNYIQDPKGLIRMLTTIRTDHTIPDAHSTYQEFGWYEYNYK
jgi:hypothetical protein